MEERKTRDQPGIPFRVVRAAEDRVRAPDRSLRRLVGSVIGHGYVRRASTRYYRRRRAHAAFTIQSLFRRSQQRKRINRRINKTRKKTTMAKRKRKRRGSKRVKKRKRAFKRRRRVSMRRSGLRLYPGGFPKTKTIALRTYSQNTIHTAAGKWGFIYFYPNNPLDSFAYHGTESDPGTHTRLKITNHLGADTPDPRPYGWDQLMGTTTAAPGSNARLYQKWLVLGSKTTITFVQGSTEADQQSARFLAGWAPRTYAGEEFHVPGFADTFQHIARTEVADWMNVKVVKNPRTLKLAGEGTALSKGGQSFVFRWSLKKEQARVKRLGLPDHGSHWSGAGKATAPPIRPEAFFMIADIGASTTSRQFNCFIETVWTIKCYDTVIPQESSSDSNPVYPPP